MTVPKIHRPSKGGCKCGRPLTDEALCRGCMKPQEQCDCGEIIRPQKVKESAAEMTEDDFQEHKEVAEEALRRHRPT